MKMKRKITLAATAIIFSTACFAQKISADKVPNVVQMAFNKSYADAKGTKWDKEKADYEASFKLNGDDISVLFDAKGEILETEKDITSKDLPMVIQNALKGKKITEAAIITKKGVNYYEAEVGGKDLLFDVNGKKVNL